MRLYWAWLTSDEAYGDFNFHKDGRLVIGQYHFSQKWKPFESDNDIQKRHKKVENGLVSFY